MDGGARTAAIAVRDSHAREIARAIEVGCCRWDSKLPNSGKPEFDCMKFSEIFAVTFESPLTLRSYLLRGRFEFERCCSHMRQPAQTKREQEERTVNERLRKAFV
ncbi:MAG TPA: hypothetical protein VGH62_08400, partial [Bradyrhizobium sp.]